MRRISEFYGMNPLEWRKSPYIYAHLEIATTPLGPIRVRQEAEGNGYTAILPPALAQGAPSSLRAERQLINRPSMQSAQLAAEERLFLHVRSILSGSWKNIVWKRKENCSGEHYLGYSHFGRWQIGFAFDDGPRMGYITSPSMTDDPRSPRPYYPHASLADLKETVADLNVEIAKKSVVYIEDAYQAMLTKQGELKKLSWDALGKRSRLKTPVGEFLITPISEEDPDTLYVCALPWMISEHVENMALMPEKDMEALKSKAEDLIKETTYRIAA